MANLLPFAYPRILSRMHWCSRSNFSGLLCGTQRNGSLLEDRLESHFNKVMKCENIPLLSNFNVYKKCLPQRHLVGIGNVPLYQLPHWTCEDDMAQQLKEDGCHVRYYLTAPGCSGKTSSILPAFLKSAEEGGFTHYLYLDFANNGHQFYRMPYKDLTQQKIYVNAVTKCS